MLTNDPPVQEGYRLALDSRAASDPTQFQANWDKFLREINVHYQHIKEAKRNKTLLAEPPPIAPAIAYRPKNAAKVAYQYPLPETSAHYTRQLQQVYNWQDKPTDENSFRQKFVDEAKARGITRSQVTDIYKFETGGKGTHDFKAHNSSALGYVQMLAHNSLAKVDAHGAEYAAIFKSMAAKATDPNVKKDYEHKAAVLLDMQRDIKKIDDLYKTSPLLPYEIEQGGREPRNKEERYTWFANLDAQRVPDGHALAQYRSKGAAIHGLLMTPELGPIMQAQKLQEMKQNWFANGLKGEPTAPQLEFINLIGESAAIPILKSKLQGDGKLADHPITNFVTKKAYLGNPILQERFDKQGNTIKSTGATQVKAIEDRMNETKDTDSSLLLASLYDAAPAAAKKIPVPKKKPDQVA